MSLINQQPRPYVTGVAQVAVHSVGPGYGAGAPMGQAHDAHGPGSFSLSSKVGAPQVVDIYFWSDGLTTWQSYRTYDTAVPVASVPTSMSANDLDLIQRTMKDEITRQMTPVVEKVPSLHDFPVKLRSPGGAPCCYTEGERLHFVHLCLGAVPMIHVLDNRWEFSHDDDGILSVTPDVYCDACKTQGMFSRGRWLQTGAPIIDKPKDEDGC